ncbi:unnamed protein product [Rotaria sp. Silwood2]|nr:unnamed protein product [Rotaria sp. Silwood2]
MKIFIKQDEMIQKNVREYQRAQCIALRQTGMSYRTIGTNLGISRSSVQRALERFEEIGGFQDRHRSGRPKRLNKRQIHMLKHLIHNDDNRNSIHEIMKRLNESLEKPICRRTFVNYLQQCNFQFNGKFKKLSLKKQHREARLQWCLEHSNWTLDDWKQVLFSHESTFCVIKLKSTENIWHVEDDNTKQCHMGIDAADGSHRIGFWGVITWNGTGCCKIYSGSINSDVYCDILDNYLVPTVQLYRMEHNFIFQYGNDSFHRSKQTQAKLQELRAKVLKWSTKSPDLNPIKYLFAIISNRLRSRSIFSIKELIDGQSSEWSSIPSQLCENLIFSMPQRIQKCLTAHGNYIDY